MSSLDDLIGRTVNIDIDGLNEKSEPVEMSMVITDVQINDFYFTDKFEEPIDLEISAEPVNFKTWDKDLQDDWIDNYTGHYFRLDELKWHPDYGKKVKPL